MHKEWLKRSISFIMCGICISEKFEGINILEAQKSIKVEKLITNTE